MTKKREWGSEARGEDDDGDPPPQKEKVVQIDTSYFDKLKARLNQQPAPTYGSDKAEPEKPGGPVIYNDDGTIYRKKGAAK